MDLMQRQLELEAEMHGAGVLRFHKSNNRAIDAGSASDADWFRRLMREFVKPMSDAIGAYTDWYAKRKGKPAATLQYLKCLPHEAAAYISIKTIFDALCKQDASLQHLAQSIGQRIEDEVRFTKLEATSPKYIAAIKESLKRRNSRNYGFEADVMVHSEKELFELNTFQGLLSEGKSKVGICCTLGIDSERYEHLDKKKQFAIDFERWQAWPQADKIQLGAKLIEIFANNMLLDGKPLVEKQHYSNGISRSHQMTARLVPTPSLEKWIEGYKDELAGMSPAYGPCIVPPRDWVTPFKGGYHSEQASANLHLVKCKSRKHLRLLTSSQMPAVYKAVNSLQAVRWCVNSDLLRIAQGIRSRSIPLGMPQLHPYAVPVCPVPSIYAELRGEELLAVLDEEQTTAFKRWKREAAAVYELESKRRADVREVSATLDQASRYAEFKNLHFVYTLDFRGRIYCQSSLISPQGGDLQKALVRFADKMPLGDGVNWFLVHGANTWGKDKVSFAERVAFVQEEEFKDMCLDIAADPSTFTQWAEADSPWQFLSWCLEYAALLEHCQQGGYAEDFESFTAVAMDGSCSGIQHYSAMLRDAVGGRAVNLLPADKPQDIYGEVANVARAWMQDIIEGNGKDVPKYDELEAKYGFVKCYKMAEEWLRIGVTRSMCKKPVMTLPYGSSLLTCRESMGDYLNDLQQAENKQARALGRNPSSVYCFTDKEGELPRFEAESFAASLVWRAIGEVVIAARAGMRYIKQVAAEVAGMNQPLLWETPTGFLVKQELFVQKEDKRVKTQLLGTTYFRVMEDTKEIDSRRMQSSAAPNFVHSMDSSHLTLVVNEMAVLGINSIAVIHDSFGCHAGLVQQMRYVLRGTLKQMYESCNVLQQFKEYNEGLYLVEFQAEMPVAGSLDLAEILESDYCFA